MESLNKSTVGESLVLIAIETMRKKLVNEWLSITNVRDMGAYKTPITFVSKEDMEEVLALGKDLLLNHFIAIRKWTNKEVCET